VVGGEPIDPERLRARPTATTCVAHASLRRRGSHPRRTATDGYSVLGGS
ncbi:TraR/DksA family transcriptional regulator, partial [Cellulomonas gelida]